MALPQRATHPLPDRTPTAVVPEGRFRRCTFRRVDIGPLLRAEPSYEIACLYPDRETSMPLGNLAAAQPICAACTLPGVFRPDAD